MYLWHMATGQFSLTLLPATRAYVGGEDAIWLPYDWFECVDLDLTSEAAEYLHDGLDALLPAGEPLTRAIHIWGDDHSDNVQVLFGDKGGVEAVAVVLDPYRSSVPLIEGLCSLACDLDCVFVTDAGAIVPPSPDCVVRTMLHSPAAKFLRDAEGPVTVIA